MKKTENGTPWTYDELVVLYNLKQAKKDNKDIADIMNCSVKCRDYTADIVRKKYSGTNWEAFLKQAENKENNSDKNSHESEKQAIVETTLANQERIIRRENARTSLIIDALKSSIARMKPPKKSELIPNIKPKTKYTPEHAGVIVSDMHIGASFSLEDTGGLSEYNLNIFKRRLNKLKESVIEIANRHRHVYELPHLHVFCLGDIVAGMNEAGEWSSVYIDLDIYDQMFEGVAGLRDTIACWARLFPKITFHGVYGNHGRIGRRGTHKISTNWDRIIYNFLQQSLKDYDHIEWNLPQAWWTQNTIQNHNFYMTHGDGIKSSMGIPYYGIERAERNILGLMKEKPHYLLVGHFHNPAELLTNSSRIMMNGSFMGGDMYSLRDLFRSCKPEQKMFGIHPRKGITWTYNIHLEGED
jgi:hypothetical protein